MAGVVRFGKPDLSGLWHNADFLKLWVGETISAAGFHVTVLAMQLTATLTLGASPIQMGLLLAMESAPNLILGLFAGVWVDRLRRRPILIGADVGRAVILLSIPAAWWLGHLRMEQLYLVIFLIGCGTTFFDVAYLTFLPTLVGREQILEGNSKLQASSSLMNIVGPNLAGILVQMLAPPLALVADAVSYLCSAVCLGLIRTPEAAPRPHGGRTTVWSDVRDGLAAALRSLILRALMIAGINFALFNSMRGALSVLYMTHGLGVRPGLLGVIYGVGGVGALLGAVLARRVAVHLGLGRTIIAIHVLFGLATLLMPAASLVPSAVVPVLLVGQFTSAFWGPMWAINGNGLRQSLTPEHLLGRVNATNRFLYMGTSPLGALLGGVLGGLIGLRPTLVVASCGIMLGSAWLLLSPIRHLRDVPPH